MKKKIIIAAFVALISSSALSAMPVDIYGGPDNGTQTIHHCGFLPTQSGIYTTSPALTRLVERKLVTLGYLRGAPDGVFGKAEKKAVARFQYDNGLKADGVVGPQTAQLLAYESHPSKNVQRCYGLARGY